MATPLCSIQVGARFETKKALRQACQMLATRTNFEYKVVKSDQSRMILKCLDPECSWRLHASRIVAGENSVFEVRQCIFSILVLGFIILGISKYLRSLLLLKFKPKLKTNRHIVLQILSKIYVVSKEFT